MEFNYLEPLSTHHMAYVMLLQSFLLKFLTVVNKIIRIVDSFLVSYTTNLLGLYQHSNHKAKEDTHIINLNFNEDNQNILHIMLHDFELLIQMQIILLKMQEYIYYNLNMELLLHLLNKYSLLQVLLSSKCFLKLHNYHTD